MIDRIDHKPSAEEVESLHDRVKVAYNVILLTYWRKRISVDDIVRCTGIPAETVETEINTIKKDIGGIRGGPKKGYSITNDVDARSALMDWVSSHQPSTLQP